MEEKKVQKNANRGGLDSKNNPDVIGQGPPTHDREKRNLRGASELRDGT